MCVGYGACADAAPRSLRLDADGKAVPVADVVEDDEVLEAEQACPLAAISAYVVAEREAA